MREDPSSVDELFASRSRMQSGCSFSWPVLAFLIVLLVSGIIGLALNLMDHSKKVPVPTSTNKPQPTLTRVINPIIHPSTTPLPPNCLHWDQVTADMKGKSVCVRDVVHSLTQTRRVGSRYAFSDQPNTFFLFSAQWEVIDEESGKTLAPGTCIELTAIIEVQSDVPFVNLDRLIEGKHFRDLHGMNDVNACR